MCGIVGAVAQRDVALILLEGLKRLEYRGYDSAGVAVINNKQQIERMRTLGKVEKLQQGLAANFLFGHVGIAHTRWATHGKPSENNAHPHVSGDEIAVVHNGIIENHEKLRQQLLADGYNFSSETDTEVVAHLLHQHLVKQGKDFLTAVKQVKTQLEGAFALAFIYRNEPNRLIAVRSGSPLVVGIGIGEYFVASDHLALLPVTQRFMYLEEGDLVDMNCQGITVYAANNEKAERAIHASNLSHDMVDKGKYRHFMQKEIFEQPQAIISTLEARLGQDYIVDEIFGAQAKELLADIKRVQIVACGTSYHAGMVGKYWLENLARIPCQVEIASEIRYRHPMVEPNTLFVTLSQSGETADTLGALRAAKEQGYRLSLTICNAPESALVRESDLKLITRAGPEIGVASTKAFTTQLTALSLLTSVLGKSRHLNPEKNLELIQQLNSLPKIIEQVLQLDSTIQQLARKFIDKQHALFLGRGIYYPIALEGALKLKEISYIHAEAYPAGELKHGPLALVDNEMPVVVLVPNDELLDKVKSNIQEVQARGGQLIVFVDEEVDIIASEQTEVIRLPKVPNLIAPIVFTIPLQLLAYYVAILKGTDVDQPRNLAKSVTVE